MTLGIRKLGFAACVLILALAAPACKRNDPIYELKPEAGEAEVVQWDMMEDQPKYIKVRKSERDMILIAEERKKRRMKNMAIYQNIPGYTE